MESINYAPELCETDEFRVSKWRNILDSVVVVDDLFPDGDYPPDIGVREPRRPKLGPRVGAIALKLEHCQVSVCK